MRVEATPVRGAVAMASGVLVGLGTFLPWQRVVVEGRERTTLRGWDVGADAWWCLLLAVVGVVAGWVLTRPRPPAAALVASVALVAAGAVGMGLALLQADRALVDIRIAQLTSRPAAGLAAVGLGGLGLLVAGIWMRWRPAAE